MIGSLRGTVLERGSDGRVLLEVGGVGYLVTVTPRTLAELEPTTSAFLHVHHHIREDAQTLYGFPSRSERATFDVLVATHGVGPALALGILATHTPSALVDIVASSDLASLCLAALTISGSRFCSQATCVRFSNSIRSAPPSRSTLMAPSSQPRSSASS